MDRRRRLGQTSQRGQVRVSMLVVGLVLTLTGVFGLQTASYGASASITTGGPLTNITISDVLNCSVNHTGDTDGEFFFDTACGTFALVGTTLYGPTDIPAGENATTSAGYAPWTPVSQSTVTGAGTSGDPFKIVTVVDAGSTGVRVTETDSYVTGQETYRTDVVVSNTGSAATVRLWRAGDCFLQDSDSGFGRVDGAAVSCVGEAFDTGGAVTGPGSRIEQWFPLTGGSHYFEDAYDVVWQRIGDHLAFPDTCVCGSDPAVDDIDNGAGLSWDFTVPNGGSVTESHLTSFSPAGIQPLSTTKTADVGSVPAGADDGYTITIHNPNASQATVDAITDLMPSGFSYRAGTTTGATTSNPSISGQSLAWGGPFTVPANGNLTLHFGVTVSATPGTYFNNAGGTGATAVAPTGDTAPITVTQPTSSTTSTSTTTPGGSTTSTTTPGGSTTTSTTTPGASTTSTTTPGGSTTSTTTPGGSTTSTTTPGGSTTTSTSTTSTTTPGTATTTTTTSAACDATETTSSVNPSSVASGTAVTASDTCFLPGAELQATFESTPTSLGTVRADASGRYSLTFTVPAAATVGTHHVVVTGPGPQNQSRRSTGTITVTSTQVAGTALPRTGAPGHLRDLSTLAGLSLLAGSVLLGVGNQGRRRPSAAGTRAQQALDRALGLD
jgi:hypothetical protein